MTERAQQLHATAENQISELITLISTLDDASAAAAMSRPREARRRNHRRVRRAHTARQLSADRRVRQAGDWTSADTRNRAGTPVIASPVPPRLRPRTPRPRRWRRPTRQRVHSRQNRSACRHRAALSLGRWPRSDCCADRPPTGRDPTQGQLQILRRETHPRTGPRQPPQAPKPPARRPHSRHRISARRQRVCESGSRVIAYVWPPTLADPHNSRRSPWSATESPVAPLSPHAGRG